MTTFPRALIEVNIAAPADEVWRALRDKDRLAQWFGWETDSLGDEIDYIFFGDHAQPDEAARKLRFDGDPDWFEVEARGDKSCVVRFMRPAPTAEHSWEDIFEDVTQGWIAFVQQLRFMMDRHRADKRRTLFLSGSPVKPNAPLAAKAFGLPATGAAGGDYKVTAPMGDALAGKVWHRGPHQLGLTVDGVGDGLLVVMDRPADAKYANGHSQVILTTYGLSDRAYDELAARWKTWWSERFDSKMPGCA